MFPPEEKLSYLNLSTFISDGDADSGVDESTESWNGMQFRKRKLSMKDTIPVVAITILFIFIVLEPA